MRTGIGELCKGSTTDSDSVCEGSNPSPAAKIKAAEILGFNGFRRLLFSLTYSSKAYRDSISIWELLYKGWFTPPTALHRLTVHLWQSDNQQRERRRIYNGAWHAGRWPCSIVYASPSSPTNGKLMKRLYPPFGC